MGAAPQKSITENTGVALRGWDLFCSRRAALARLPTQGAAKLLAGLPRPVWSQRRKARAA